MVPGGTGHQLTVPTGKADPAPPRARSADLTEVKGAHTPAGGSATPTPPHPTPGSSRAKGWPGSPRRGTVTASVLSSPRLPAHTNNRRGNLSGCTSNSGFKDVDSMASGVLGFLVFPRLRKNPLLGKCERGHYGYRGASPLRREPGPPGDLRLHTRPARAPSPWLPEREQCGSAPPGACGSPSPVSNVARERVGRKTPVPRLRLAALQAGDPFPRPGG